ncbi:5,10-methylenetetrahydrofolate reductase [Rubrobacter taiwanensis]|uniref:Methylenetetrahydrofolate reductase n=1 Tax=Rubrobacter taiwanensis TaxID=185139 RepID=A0A4R1B708_9ACTN|nr:methylenetetrahydrofolate reductase [Rubrobacter taiwanensis]TCJ11885.1 5,10-methylenetetrahydrofolate reductase [Rubrobacter taiwanensis]
MEIGDVRYEVIPLAGVEELVSEHVPKEVALTITASPVRGMGPTVELAERLAGAGWRVVPHLSARLVRDEGHLEEIVGRLQGAGVRDVFVIGGDAREPAGRFEGSAELLRAMHELGHCFEEVGIAGYPEGHPFIGDEDLSRAMEKKAPYATYIVSQICFDAELITGWAWRVKRRGIELPIWVGVPAPVESKKLFRISTRIGLGESARFLKKQRNWLIRLFLSSFSSSSSGYNPDPLVDALAPALLDPKSNIEGLHIYTFNELEKTEAWRAAKRWKLAKSEHEEKNF